MAASTSAKRSVIWLHGLGDTGAGWSSLASTFAPRLPSVAWQFPNAPVRPVTLSPGYDMPAWFDLNDLPVTAATPATAADYAHGTSIVHGLIDAEVAKGVAPEHIVLGGFSQGGALSLYAGLRYPKRLGGIVSFSGWLPLWEEQLKPLPGLGGAKVLMVHGSRDDKVLFERGQHARDTLTPVAGKVEWHEFRGGHEFHQPSVTWLEGFLKEALGL